MFHRAISRSSYKVPRRLRMFYSGDGVVWTCISMVGLVLRRQSARNCEVSVWKIYGWSCSKEKVRKNEAREVSLFLFSFDRIKIRQRNEEKGEDLTRTYVHSNSRIKCFETLENSSIHTYEKPLSSKMIIISTKKENVTKDIKIRWSLSQ